MTATQHLDEKKQKAAALYAEGLSNLAIGKEVGVSQESVRKWAVTPEFKAEVRRIRERSVEETVGVLATVGRKSADTLLEMLGRDNLTDREKLTAIKLGLEFMFKGIEAINVVTELAELKEMVGRLSDGDVESNL